tara:strand:- start:749 stop:1774 length:1026 start_codon:yes stop_codon:yes gene_type:complete
MGTLNVAKAKGWLIPEQPKIEFTDENTIRLDSLTLEQKIAQMIIVHGGEHNLEAWRNMQLGGIHLFAMETPERYKEVINKFQDGMNVPFFVTADLEGCLNPFANFRASTPISEISSIGDAFEKGSVDGKFLYELGFSLNFAPVVDLNDEIWGCRSFPGDEKEVSELAESYILGLQKEGIIATAKHYPGKTLVVKDPHKHLVVADIDQEDIYPYQYLSKKGHDNAFMVSHLIVSGETISKGIPSVVSEDVIDELKKDNLGLIISDDTMMLGLRNFYDNVDNLYIDVFKAGNDLILNFDEDPLEIYRMILVIKSAVEDGRISEEKINDSVRKILESKGLIVLI